MKRQPIVKYKKHQGSALIRFTNEKWNDETAIHYDGVYITKEGYAVQVFGHQPYGQWEAYSNLAIVIDGYQYSETSDTWYSSSHSIALAASSFVKRVLKFIEENM